MPSIIPTNTFGPNGFVSPNETTDILPAVLAEFNTAFGGNLNTTNLSTPQGQLASSLTAIIGDKNDQFLQYTNSVDPKYAFGRMQDGIARIYFIEREPAIPTITQVNCNGAAGTVIPNGAEIAANDKNRYVCTQSGTIPSSGLITLPFQCSVNGPIVCAAQQFVIASNITGWDTAISTTPGVIGRDTEGRDEFEARRAASVSRAATGSLGSVLGAILSVPNVIDARVVQNPSSVGAMVSGMALPAHSICAIAVGGDEGNIGAAILYGNNPGCETFGNTNVTLYDNAYSAPFPTYNVAFHRPSQAAIYVQVAIANSSFVPADAQTQIANAIISAFAGLDGGQRIRLGTQILASRFYGPIIALGDWARIVNIKIGLDINTMVNDSFVLPINQQPTISAQTISLVLL